MEQVTFADVEYEGKKRRDAAGAVSGADGGADSVGASGGAGFGRCIRRRAGGGSRTRWRRC